MLKWSKELFSGIEDIDKQHRLIIICVRDILSACGKNEPNEKILKLINSFDSYVNEHFETEEKYAEFYNFPKIEQLKKEHELFKQLYLNLRYHYHYYNVSSDTFSFVYVYAIHLTKTLEEWLIFHLNTLDKELIDYLKLKIIKDNPSNL